MIINGQALLQANPIQGMATRKMRVHGYSYGLSEVGYDIRLKQEVSFYPPEFTLGTKKKFFGYTTVDGVVSYGRTALASSVECFHLPLNLWGELRNKSTIARQFVDATLGTDMEPGWEGFLTLEFIFHGLEPITFPAGCPIAKAVFHEIKERASYDGKYQHQDNQPQEAKFS